MKYCDTCRSSYPVEFTTCPRDQAALRSVTDLVPGMVLRGKYEILGRLGVGGMGAVYKARHVLFGELRAIKVLGAHLLGDEGYRARFRSEAAVARKLSHPNAVRIEDFDTTEDGRPFIVMEYAEGRSVRHLLHYEGRLAVERAVAFARQACEALAAAHRLGIVHRDIKPDNMIVVPRPDGTEWLKVLDFGLAKIREGFEGGAGQVATRTGILIGTPEYMSPEQASGTRGDELDGRSDLYALGIVLYEMLTGRVPFHSDTPVSTVLQQLHDAPRPPRELRPDLPEPVAAVVLRALAKDPAERFASAEAMGQALGGGPPTAAVVAPVTAVRSGPKPARREATPPPAPHVGRPVLILLAAGVVGVMMIGMMLAASRGGRVVPPSPVPRVDGEVAAVETAAGEAAAPSEPSGRDAEIHNAVQQLLFGSSALRDARISIEVVNGIVTLSGEVPTPTAGDLAVTLARSVSGVRQVFSTLRPPPTEEAAATPPPATPPPDAPPPPGRADGERVRELLDQARTAMETRNAPAAQEAFEAVLRLDPQNAIARMGLERLRQGLPPGPPGGPPPPRQQD